MKIRTRISDGEFGLKILYVGRDRRAHRQARLENGDSDKLTSQ
jgi:hypothetical protein